MIYKIKNKCKSTRFTRRVSLSSFLAVALLAVSCSDRSDYNTVPESQLTSGTSLWQNIVSNSSLNDFATLVQKSGLDINLKGANYYTVMAPLDGTYDMQQFLTADSAKATEQFVKQHISNYSTVISGDQTYMLRTQNGKIHYVNSQGVTDAEGNDQVNFALTNAPASNGILHILKGQLPWRPNVYEYTDSAENCDSFKVYVKKFETSYIDVANSVPGPPDVNGKITYLDSTVVYTNSYYDRLFMRADVEDSIYTMVYLTNNAWNTAKAKMQPEFKYIATYKYNDWANIEASKKTAVNGSMPADVAMKELTVDAELYNDSVYKYRMTNRLSFSMKHPNNKKWLAPDRIVTIEDDDTIVTTNNLRIPGGALAIQKNGVNIEGGKVKNLSNGYARIIDKLWYTDEYGFKSWDTYKPTLVYNTRRDIAYYHPTNSTLTTYVLLGEVAGNPEIWSDLTDAGKPFIDKVVIPELFDKRFDSDLRFVSINPNSTTNSSFCVALKNVLATTYRVIMVTAPPLSYSPFVAPKKQKFSFWIDYFDGTVQKVDAFPIKDEVQSDKFVYKSESQSNKFSYFDLGNVTFPISYYGLDAYPTLRVQCTNSSDPEEYESVINLAGVILIPKEAVDFYGE